MRYEYQKRMNKAVCETYKVLREVKETNELDKLHSTVWHLGCKYASCGYEGKSKKFEPLLKKITDARNNDGELDFNKVEKKLDSLTRY